MHPPSPDSARPTDEEPAPRATLFLLSPANLSGKRGQLLLDSQSSFDLAKRLRSGSGAPLGEVFSFVSSLYFRGKLGYARHFGHAAHGAAAAFVMTAGGGLYEPDAPVTLARVQGWQQVSVNENNPHFTAPLIRQVCELSELHPADSRFVLLGSVASQKYVTPLLEALGPRLLFPTPFAGLGDMSRGALLLRAARDDVELPYSLVASKGGRARL